MARSRPVLTPRTVQSLPIGIELVRVVALLGGAVLAVLVALPTLVALAATAFD